MANLLSGFPKLSLEIHEFYLMQGWPQVQGKKQGLVACRLRVLSLTIATLCINIES